MQLHSLPKITSDRTRRLGRGSGSGRGKTAGRGTKGQKSRGAIRSGFEGGQLPLIKRLPLYRGRSRNKSFGPRIYVINLKVLSLLPKDSVVDVETLIKQKVLAADARDKRVKILGDGEIKHALIIKLPISKSARKKVEAAGGKIEIANTLTDSDQKAPPSTSKEKVKA